MKAIFKLCIFAAMPAVAFWSCSQNPDVLEDFRPSVGGTVELTISTGRPDAADTRTMVAEDGVTPMWCPEDAIGVSVCLNGTYTNHEFTNDNMDEPSVTTTFSGTTAVGDLLYSYYPYSASGVDAEGKVLMTIPAVQHPTATSFDGAADILVGKPVVMTPATTKIEGLQFKRAGGFLKIVINDQSGMLAEETFYKISVTAENDLAGDVYLDIVNGQLGEIYANGSTTVTAKFGEGNDGTAWLGIYPQTLTEGSTITIAATTDSYDIEREISLPYDIEVKEGQITTLNIKITAENISERVLIIDEIFPDPIFRQYVSDNFDKNHDGILSKDEALAVTYINVNKFSYNPDEEKIASLEGMQYFTSLQILCCDYNKLTTLNVSKNTALTELWCQNNQLTSLDVSNNTFLSSLWCIGNQLTALDVSKNTDLTTLDCRSNQLTTLDMSKNTALETLWCTSNSLTTLDVSKNTALGGLDCGWNQLTTLDMSKNTALTSLSCGNNQLTALDVSKNTALKILQCFDNPLTTLDISNNTALTTLYCYNNPLTTLDMSKNTALTRLDCYDSQLTTLDVSGCSALTYLYCNDNQLTTLDVSKNTALIVLICSNNQLTILDVSKNTALIGLDCESNQLTTLDVSKTNLGNSPYYDALYCYMETLTTLYLKKDWEINGITSNRDTRYISDQTNIVYVD